MKPDEPDSPDSRTFKGQTKLRQEVLSVVSAWLNHAHTQLSHIDDDREKRIHDTRTGLKRLRSILRLTRPGLDDQSFQLENATYRDAARLLSEARDATVLVECLDKLVAQAEQPQEAFEQTRQWLLKHRKQKLASLTEHKPEVEALSALEVAQGRSKTWTAQLSRWGIIEDGFSKTYKRGRRLLSELEAAPHPELMHEFRKQVKHHLYQTQMLTPIWPKALKKRYALAKQLSDILGYSNDLHLLEQSLIHEYAVPNGPVEAPVVSHPDVTQSTEAGPTPGPQAAAHRTLLDRRMDGPPPPSEDERQKLLELIDSRQTKLRNAALSLGVELYSKSPKSLRKGLHKRIKASGD